MKRSCTAPDEVAEFPRSVWAILVSATARTRLGFGFLTSRSLFRGFCSRLCGRLCGIPVGFFLVLGGFLTVPSTVFFFFFRSVFSFFFVFFSSVSAFFFFFFPSVFTV